MKTLSIRQPFASLICRGIKTIENRSWNTQYRGKLLIHASSKAIAWPTFNYLPKGFINGYKNYYGSSIDTMPKEYSSYIKWLEEISYFYHLKNTPFNVPENIKVLTKQYGHALPVQAIIGEVQLVDIVKDSKNFWACPRNYHWVLANPVLFEKPILNVLGKLNLWEYDLMKGTPNE